MPSIGQKHEHLCSELVSNPDYFLHTLDFVNNRALVVEINETIYRKAAFLDNRMLTRNTKGAWIDLNVLLDGLGDKLKNGISHYLFHIGQCGSTLISRLLGELPELFSLREPLAVLNLAMQLRELKKPIARLSPGQWERTIETVLRILSRSYYDRTALVKATSACTNLVDYVLNYNTRSRALLLYVDLETYLATMLRVERMQEITRQNSALWLNDFHELTRRTDISLHSLSVAQQACLNWLMPVLTFVKMSESHSNRTLLLDFEEFLQAPSGKLESTAKFLGCTPSPRQLDGIVQGKTMRSYSKDQDYAYNPVTRRQEIESSARIFHDEIARCIDWAAELCRTSHELEGVQVYFYKKNT